MGRSNPAINHRITEYLVVSRCQRCRLPNRRHVCPVLSHNEILGPIRSLSNPPPNNRPLDSRQPRPPRWHCLIITPGKPDATVKLTPDRLAWRNHRPRITTLDRSGRVVKPQPSLLGPRPVTLKAMPLQDG